MSYAVNLPDVFRQAAVYADRIAKGANPGELPMFPPDRFERVTKLTTAKAPGIQVRRRPAGTEAASSRSSTPLVIGGN